MRLGRVCRCTKRVASLLAVLALTSCGGGATGSATTKYALSSSAANYTSYPGITYSQPNGTALNLDLYVPDGVGPFPVVVWIHGGSWMYGDRFNPPALPLTGRGYAVASIEYRLSTQAIFPAQVQDAKASIRWLRAHANDYRLDGKRIAAFGGSAGGHIAALVGTTSGTTALEDLGTGNASYSSRVQAVVDWFGPTDFGEEDKHALACAANFPPLKDAEDVLLGCDVNGCEDKVAEANPLTYVTRSAPPFLIQHGTADCIVAPYASELLDAALTNAGASSRLQWFANAGHGTPEFTTADNIKTIADFLDRALAR